MNIIEIKYTDKAYPKRLLQIENFPRTLYATGDIGLLNREHVLGMVGSRKCSEYGRKVADIFARELSKSNITIISGLAIGIDAASHIGAIDEVGKTIAVLGCGLNKMYPKENEWLFHKILANGGCIISEYKQDVEPDMRYFPKRNRIISGISDGVLIVEASANRSGSIITAKYAKEQEKKVYVIPSNIDSTTGVGTNILIMEGATLVTKPSYIKKDLIRRQLFKNKKSK